ncbi:PaaI family thioesterase [Danxiaibacter flavus]|uniref:PaaI family thioesterase n=1 Tax=Danxiaibacter flavus TaxID=3049108 RepID=A0ABV3ZEM0_9BACT|nr:PaaI family thioesterase [Chitinophagaceae bacterium DXS]
MTTKNRCRTYAWDDPLAGASKARTMSGMEYLQAMSSGEIPLPPLLYTLGFSKPEIAEGEATFLFEPQEYHFNPLGSVHGGVITAVLDSAMGCTLQSVLPKGTGYTTLELKVNFLKGINLQTPVLSATGKIIHKGKTTALVEADLRDKEGVVYAHAVSTCLMFNF